MCVCVCVVVARGGFPQRRADGHTRDLVFQLHLRRWETEGGLRRNFSLWWRWSKGKRQVAWKKFGISVQKNKNARRHWRCRDPCSGKLGQLVVVAVRTKERNWAPDAMDGLGAGHKMEHSGWITLDWTKTRSLPKGTDPSKGDCRNRD